MIDWYIDKTPLQCSTFVNSIEIVDFSKSLCLAHFEKNMWQLNWKLNEADRISTKSLEFLVGKFFLIIKWILNLFFIYFYIISFIQSYSIWEFPIQKRQKGVSFIRCRNFFTNESNESKNLINPDKIENKRLQFYRHQFRKQTERLETQMN